MKNKKQLLRAKADKLWYSKYTKSHCEVCGSNEFVVGHHFYFKGNYGHLRYDKNNCVSLCKSCHFILHHQDQKKIEEVIIEKKGKAWYNKIKKKSREKPAGSYQTISWYQEQIEKLKNEI